ncbi:UDP-3-O-acyl-N-acetylglucosamine deacetylase [Thermodesulfobacteriota bacterium]
MFQRTLAGIASCSGIGLHSGKRVHITIKPAPANHGIRFVRKDLPDSPTILAHLKYVVDTSQATVIGNNGVIISTIEHLMATFAGLCVDNALVELDSYEVPIMDGSAEPFTGLLKRTGITAQNAHRYHFKVKKPVEVSEDGRSVSIYPSDQLRISCTIDFDHPLLRNQSLAVSVTEEVFEKEVSPARTFGFFHELDYLKKFGFAKGGSLENALVLGSDGILNENGLRFENEFVRHKILDCLGDLSLLGIPILGHIVTYKSGHTFNHAFLKTFFTSRDCWDTVSCA